MQLETGYHIVMMRAECSVDMNPEHECEQTVAFM